MKSVEDRVNRGSEVLFGMVGDKWFDEIDLDILDIYSTTHCILGQIYSEYSTGCLALRKLSPGEGFLDPFMLGFAPVHVDGMPGFEEECESLNNEWAKKILSLRNPEHKPSINDELEEIRKKLHSISEVVTEELDYGDICTLRSIELSLFHVINRPDKDAV